MNDMRKRKGLGELTLRVLERNLSLLIFIFLEVGDKT